MTAEQLFSILNLMTIAAWLPLVFLPRVRWSATVVPMVMPVLLAITYLALLIATLPWSEGGFSSLAGVRALFDNPWGLLAGWTHYLAFDLFIGGARIEGNFPIGPMAGCAFNLTTMSYGGRLDMGCMMDTAAIDDPALLKRCLVESFDELLAFAV